MNSKRLVLQSFKNLHRTRLKVFEGDFRALTAARIKINEEFRKNKNVTDEGSIRTMIKFVQDVETELRTQIIQAREVKPGVYEAKITKDTLKLDNVPYNDNAVLEDNGEKSHTCCQNPVTNK